MCVLGSKLLNICFTAKTCGFFFFSSIPIRKKSDFQYIAQNTFEDVVHCLKCNNADRPNRNWHLTRLRTDIFFGEFKVTCNMKSELSRGSTISQVIIMSSSTDHQGYGESTLSQIHILHKTFFMLCATSMLNQITIKNTKHWHVSKQCCMQNRIPWLI